MQFNTLQPKTRRLKVKHVGRGGKRGKTSGRGTKGQNARAGRKKRPELRDFIKRFPKLRGRGVSSLKPLKDKPFIVNLSLIDKLYKPGEVVNQKSLEEKKLVSRQGAIKILGSGSLSQVLTFEGVELSTHAREKVEKAGGKIL